MPGQQDARIWIKKQNINRCSHHTDEGGPQFFTEAGADTGVEIRFPYIKRSGL